MAAYTITVGTRSDETVNITAVAGTGPYTITLAATTSTTLVGDKLKDEYSTERFYLITAVSGTSLTVADIWGNGAPTADGGGTAHTEMAYSNLSNAEGGLGSFSGHDVTVEVRTSETITSGIVWNDTAPSSYIIKGVPAHTGTAGTGISFTTTSQIKIIEKSASTTPTLTIQELEFVGGFEAIRILNGSGTTNIQRNIVHGQRTTAGSPWTAVVGIHNAAYSNTVNIHNNIVYDVKNIYTSALYDTYVAGIRVYLGTNSICNNTVWDIDNDLTHANDAAYGIRNEVTTTTCKNNVVATVAAVNPACFSSTTSWTTATNASDDSTAPSPIATEPIAASTEFVTTSPVNLHLKAGAECINTGTDLVTTPTGVQFDIDGYDRDTGGVTWDVGADEYISSAIDLTVANAAHTHSAASPTLTQTHVLAVAGAAHDHVVASPTLTQTHVLTVANAAHDHAVASPAITQTHVLVVANAAHDHVVANVVLDTAIMLVVDSAVHDHASTTVALTQVHSLVVAGCDHVHAVGNVTLTQVHGLAVDSTYHAHVVDNVETTTATLLVVDSAVHSHAAANVTLSQVHSLAVESAAHLHVAGAAALTQVHALTVSNAAHVHAVGNVLLDFAVTLVVQNAVHSHAVTAVTVTPAEPLDFDHYHKLAGPSLYVYAFEGPSEYSYRLQRKP